MSEENQPEDQPPKADDASAAPMEDVSISLDSHEPSATPPPTETSEGKIQEEPPADEAPAEEVPEEVVAEVGETVAVTTDEAEEEVVDNVNEEAEKEEEKEKNKNPLEAVGGWFQKLGGGASKSNVVPATTTEPKEEEEPELVEQAEMGGSNVVIASDESEMPEEEKPMEADSEAADETEEKAKIHAGWGLGVGALFASKAKGVESEPKVLSSEDDEPLDIHPEEIKIEEDKKTSWGLNLFGKNKAHSDEENPTESTLKELSMDEQPGDKKAAPGWGQGLGTIFRKNKKVGIESSEADGCKDSGKDDDENEKKKGGFRQQCSAFYRSKEGKIVIFSCIALFVMLSIVVPILVTAEDDITTYMKAVGKVDTYLQAQMIKHPSYKGDLYPEGHVTLRFDVENRFLATFRVGGVDQSCDGCTWMIEEGNTCHDATKLGQLHYNHQDEALVAFNPFMHTFYTAKDGVAEGASVTYNGYTLEENMDNVIVMNNAAGQSFACGVLHKQGHPATYPKLYANVRSLPAYASKAEADVKVRVDFYADRAFHLGFTGTGLAPNCGIMCQIAFYTGTSCEEAVGETLWNPLKLPFDPWSSVSGAFYATDSNGTLTGRPGFYLYDGFGREDHENRIVLFRDAGGAALACGELRDSARHVWRERVVADVAASGQTIAQHGFLRTEMVAANAATTMTTTEGDGGSIVVDQAQQPNIVTADMAGTVMNAGISAIHALEHPFQTKE